MTVDIRIAVVGAGLIGQRHAAALLQAAGVTLDCIVEPGTGGAACADAAGVPCFAALDAVLGGRGPDGIVLATPTALHEEQGLACVAAGVPVLIEKPVCVTTAQAQRLVSAADLAGVPLLVGHHRRHNGLVARAKEMIDGGAIGSVRAVHGTCWFYKPDAYFDAAPWRTEPGAGPISVNLVHDVDLMRHLCGEVIRVQATAAAARRGYANEDVAAAVLTFANGAIGTLTVSDAIAAPWSWEMTARENPAYPPTGENFMTIGGSEGSLSLPDLTLWRHEGPQSWWSPMSATRAPVDARADPLVTQMTHFGAVIRGETAPLVSGAEGLATLAVIEAIAQAASTGTAQVPVTDGR